MKIRNGFVSNSSSTSFVILLNKSTRPLAHYEWIVSDEEYLSSEDETAWIWEDKDYKDKDLVEINRKELLEQRGYTLDIEKSEGNSFKYF